MREPILAIALVFIAVLAVAQVHARGGAVNSNVFTRFMLALFGFGVVGALRHPPDE